MPKPAPIPRIQNQHASSTPRSPAGPENKHGNPAPRSPMPAYVVVEIAVRDGETYERYKALAPA
jgi:hypothetical protein